MIPQTVSEAFSLRGQTALITGGGTGIGLAIARAMHAAGAQVVLVGRRGAELAQAAQEIGAGSFAFAHDVTDAAAAPALIARAEAAAGPITCLVNNAGIHFKKAAVETSVEDFEQVLRTHVIGAHALTVALAPGMMARRAGSILFTASMASLFGIPQVVAYAAAKSAHLGMVRTYATEFSPYGVRVNAVAPGWIDTALSRRSMAGDPKRKERIISRTPMGVFGDSMDIGWAAVYLASPAARFVTGVILPVDGGISIGF